MDSKYYNKYLKYRSKYLALKKTKTLQKGGAFGAENFINKLREIAQYLSINIEHDPQAMIEYIQSIWDETIHLKTIEMYSNPTTLEHYTNLKAWLDMFNEKYSDDLSRGYRELEEYEQINKFPQGCLDYKITWFGEFLTPEISIFRENDIPNNQRVLGEIIDKIVLQMCQNTKFDTKTKYEFGMSKKRLLFTVKHNRDVIDALDKNIITSKFIEDLFEILWKYYEHELFENILDCDDKINKLPD